MRLAIILILFFGGMLLAWSGWGHELAEWLASWFG